MSEKDPPDFAMMRAVELLAQIYERARTQPNVPPPPLDRPVQLFNESFSFQLGKSHQDDVQRALGIGFPYPTKGWHTYAVAGERNERYLLSVFYRRREVIAVELYVPTTDRAPALEPRRLGAFRFVPGEIRLGMPSTAIPETFVTAVGGPGAVVYEHAYEARFDGGVAYAFSNAGTVERLALYSQDIELPA
ncbi:MAG: hypothetical protein JOZ38_11810 [Candidatus Eremiobacteraeota bacterium]|nr:hypothetical protein [Candidatus Eremiobacteraeota bacterium]